MYLLHWIRFYIEYNFHKIIQAVFVPEEHNELYDEVVTQRFNERYDGKYMFWYNPKTNSYFYTDHLKGHYIKQNYVSCCFLKSVNEDLQRIFPFTVVKYNSLQKLESINNCILIKEVNGDRIYTASLEYCTFLDWLNQHHMELLLEIAIMKAFRSLGSYTNKRYIITADSNGDPVVIKYKTKY